MLPSDHVIMKENQFITDLNRAFDYAQDNTAIVTLGIEPTRPDTGYGYINYAEGESSIKVVKEFKEKPDKETAQRVAILAPELSQLIVRFVRGIVDPNVSSDCGHMVFSPLVLVSLVVVISDSLAVSRNSSVLGGRGEQLLWTSTND